MAQYDESIRGQIQALLRVMNLTRCVNEDKVLCKIEEDLFLGSVGAANNKDDLKRLNVTHILTVASTLKPAYPDDFVYKVIAAKRLGGGVLVHCFVGKSRSVTIVVAYLMKKHGMSLSQALEHVKSRRRQASPNSGFISQLQEYEKFLQVLALT
ncbi:dual specificity protein phosphatase 1-like isoform X3 [Syzygium oleosum]|uniref:dual specificity protein phosphatase 1-like isoform X3 n=1 Tax=Syzygium oleosum TaxID=219896 RepID=UPI0024BB04A8|nr:dual specificity protein phosphatase 1-like isoform X3 [Syzygium oleosum]